MPRIQTKGMVAQRILLHEAEDISEFLFRATGMMPGYTQFSAGPAKLEYKVVDLDGVTLLWASGIAHCRWQDQMSDDGRVHFGIVLNARNGVRSLGHELGPEDAMLFRPGQEMDYVFLGPVETLEIGVSKEIADSLGWTFSGAPLARIHGTPLKRLESACRQASKIAGIKGKGTEVASTAAAQGMVLDALECALAPWLPHGAGSHPELSECTSRYSVLKNFDHLLSEIGDAMPDLGSISKELGVGRRTLFYSLRQSLGITPRRYVEIRRLAELRNRLKNTSPDETTVTELAIEFGFGDLGRMAGKYRQQFGEYPSQTLRH